MSRITWEYHLELAAHLDADRLGALGRDGWELVTSLPAGEAVFKRPAPDFSERITIEQRERAEREWQERER